jgi:hypothetical protein
VVRNPLLLLLQIHLLLLLSWLLLAVLEVLRRCNSCSTVCLCAHLALVQH